MGDVALETLSEIDGVVDEQWRALGEAGTWLDGRQRVAVVQAAREDVVTTPVEPSSIEDAARLVAGHASAITGETVDAIEATGIDRTMYVEIVGIVGRAAAIDTFDRGMGRSLRALPDVVEGTPSREPAAGARRRAGWVPTVGAIGPPTALSSVPREATDQESLHDVLYLSYGAMADLDADRGLHRTQMELIAARVSLLNECFF